MVCNKCNNDMICKKDLNAEEYSFPSDIEGIISVWVCPECGEKKEILTVGGEMFVIGYDPQTGERYLIV